MTLEAHHAPRPSASGRPADNGGRAGEGTSPHQIIARKARDWLRSRRLPWYLTVLAMLLCAPSLGLGWYLDDDFHRLALTRPDLPLLSRSPAELFAFVRGDEAVNHRCVVMGMLPWWSHEKLRLAFFRPVAGFTHWLDYKLWPTLPSLMHLHSLLWFGGVVVAAAFFYRRTFRCAWVAGLAALLFAVDDAHGTPAVWLANRNAVIGAFFGLFALIAHDRWRRGGRRVWAILAPLAFSIGLLSKESTVAVGAYLAAYALCLDRGSRVGRLASLVPCAGVAVLWWVAYRQLAYGTVGSGWYVDPGVDPGQFARAVLARAPILLAWQWVIPADLEWALSAKTAHVLWLAVSGLLLVGAAAMIPLLRRDPVARFWAMGMVLSVLPACTAYPDARLLFFVGLGGMGLLAQFVAGVLREWRRQPSLTWRCLPARVLGAVLVVIHLCVAPVTLARTPAFFKRVGRAAVQPAASLPAEPLAVFRTTLIVSTPSYSTFAYSALTRLLHGEPYLSRTLVLGSGGQPIAIHRPDDRTLLLHPEGGFLAYAGGAGRRGELEQLLFDQRCVMQSLDRVYRDPTRMKIGQRIGLMEVTVEITAVTDDGRPSEVACRFPFALEHPHWRWLQWKDEAYVPFPLPAVGERVTLPAATIPFGGIS